jgi:four helix bundle protein
LQIYKMTEFFPKQEAYGLTAQFRRAAVSIPANIAEGFIKRGPADKRRFFNIAEGSVEECRYYLILSRTWVTEIHRLRPNNWRKSASCFAPTARN